jgi:hypothetical protein
VVGEPKAQYYAVTAEGVRNLAAFLKATDWTCLYGIGMGTNTPARAADEADFVAKTLGDSLQYFQIGNEVDMFDRHLRDPKTWSAKTYLDEWLTFARAVTARVPGAKFGMPDVAANVDWLTQIAAAWPSVENPPHVTTLTHHYYFGGPATNPDVNIPNLLKPTAMAKVQKTADIATAAANKMTARVRMTEATLAIAAASRECPMFSPRHCGLPTIRCCLRATTTPASIYTEARGSPLQTRSAVSCREIFCSKRRVKLRSRSPPTLTHFIRPLPRSARTT